MMDVNEVMAQKNIILPEPPPRGGLYSPCRISGNMAYISGCGCVVDGCEANGKIGERYTLEEGYAFARNAMLNVLAVLKREIGDLNNVATPVKILVFVASADDFTQQPQVANGASALLGDIFGMDTGLPARSAIGVNVLPGNIPVEIEAVFELRKA